MKTQRHKPVETLFLLLLIKARHNQLLHTSESNNFREKCVCMSVYTHTLKSLYSIHTSGTRVPTTRLLRNSQRTCANLRGGGGGVGGGVERGQEVQRTCGEVKVLQEFSYSGQVVKRLNVKKDLKQNLHSLHLCCSACNTGSRLLLLPPGRMVAHTHSGFQRSICSWEAQIPRSTLLPVLLITGMCDWTE